MKTPPLKRSKELILLSKDHHQGLLLCWKIRSGINKKISAARISDYVSFFSELELKDHFKKEEEIVFSELPSDDSLKSEALKQHEVLQAMICDLGDSNYETLNEFADKLDEHIRFEERILFPHIEKQLPAERIQLLGERMTAIHKNIEDDWKDNFWLRDTV
jgi:hemerythrin-like domain-containing protein